MMLLILQPPDWVLVGMAGKTSTKYGNSVYFLWYLSSPYNISVWLGTPLQGNHNWSYVMDTSRSRRLTRRQTLCSIKRPGFSRYYHEQQFLKNVDTLLRSVSKCFLILSPFTHPAFLETSAFSRPSLQPMERDMNCTKERLTLPV